MSTIDATTVLDRALDTDSHEMVPSHLWGEEFGPAAGRIADLSYGYLTKMGGNDFLNPDYPGDVVEITDESTWTIRGTEAPASSDFGRRLAVMDVMGVHRQLVFPSYALFALKYLYGNDYVLRDLIGTDLPLDELRALGRAGLDEYNDWAVRIGAIDPDRIRPVAYLADTDSVDELVAEAAALIERGIPAVHLGSGTPPAGRSPADPELDPFWALLEANDVPLTIHVGVEASFLDGTWKRAPAFKPGKVESHEIGMDPYFFSTVHFAPYNYITVMVLGGVFERFPNLRFGALELGSAWVGPLAENLDMWADFHKGRLKPFISMRPSEYLARNVRVTPFNTVEPIETYLERWPDLVNCFCFSTDYPHVEGGSDIKRKLHQRIAPLGDGVVEKFFVTNAELLLPAR